MKTIYKYQIPLLVNSRIYLPKDAEILSFQTQNDIPVIWVLVDEIFAFPEVSKEEREFAVFGTGHEVPQDIENLKYIGTTQQSQDPPLVWHLFEIIRR